MKHPEIILLPVLMFTDYFLTVLGAIWREGKHSQHFKTGHYELNPVWQKQIGEKKWFAPRHIALTVLVSAVLAGLIEYGDIPESLTQAVLGCAFVVFATVIGRHLSNLLTFRRLTRGAGEITGEVTMSHSLTLSISMYQYLVVVLPLGIVAIFSPTPFVVGGLAGAVAVILVHAVWLRRHRKAQAKEARRGAVD